MNNHVSFFTPIQYVDGAKTYIQSAIENIDHYFYLGGKKAYVIREKNEQGYQQAYLAEGSSSLLKRIAKVLSYFTIIFPLGMLGAKAILRFTHTFCVIDVSKNINSNQTLSENRKEEYWIKEEGEDKAKIAQYGINKDFLKNTETLSFFDSINIGKHAEDLVLDYLDLEEWEKLAQDPYCNQLFLDKVEKSIKKFKQDLIYTIEKLQKEAESSIEGLQKKLAFFPIDDRAAREELDNEKLLEYFCLTFDIERENRNIARFNEVLKKLNSKAIKRDSSSADWDWDQTKQWVLQLRKECFLEPLTNLHNNLDQEESYDLFKKIELSNPQVPYFFEEIVNLARDYGPVKLHYSHISEYIKIHAYRNQFDAVIEEIQNIELEYREKYFLDFIFLLLDKKQYDKAIEIAEKFLKKENLMNEFFFSLLGRKWNQPGTLKVTPFIERILTNIEKTLNEIESGQKNNDRIPYGVQSLSYSCIALSLETVEVQERFRRIHKRIKENGEAEAEAEAEERERRIAFLIKS